MRARSRSSDTQNQTCPDLSTFCICHCSKLLGPSGALLSQHNLPHPDWHRAPSHILTPPPVLSVTPSPGSWMKQALQPSPPCAVTTSSQSKGPVRPACLARCGVCQFVRCLLKGYLDFLHIIVKPESRSHGLLLYNHPVLQQHLVSTKLLINAIQN